MFNNKQLDDMQGQILAIQRAVDSALTLSASAHAKLDTLAKHTGEIRLACDNTNGHIESVVVRTETRLCKLMEHAHVPTGISPTHSMTARRIK